MLSDNEKLLIKKKGTADNFNSYRIFSNKRPWRLLNLKLLGAALVRGRR